MPAPCTLDWALSPRPLLLPKFGAGCVTKSFMKVPSHKVERPYFLSYGQPDLGAFPIRKRVVELGAFGAATRCRLAFGCPQRMADQELDSLERELANLSK